jgi:PAS domain S-box-containing protein
LLAVRPKFSYIRYSAVRYVDDEGYMLEILHLEDNEVDGELIAEVLHGAGIAVNITRVDTGAAFLATLERARFDLILSDFALPDFDGLAALAAVRERETATPFIFVSGTIGEDRAVESLRRGATDYILKDRPNRLVAAVERALAERREREARAAAEERIREQAALLNGAREAITVTDLEGRIAYWNHGAERLYGWTTEEALAGGAKARIPPTSGEAFELAWTTALSTGTWDGPLTLTNRRGAELMVETHLTCLRHPDGSPRAIMSVEADATRARTLERQLAQAQRLETVGMIAGGVAHDLNNVLAPILIAAGSLKRRATDEAILRLLATVEMAAERGRDIVHQVLTFARGSRGSQDSFPAADMIRTIEKLILASLPKTVRLDLSIPDDLGRVAGDATQLQQVILNLCVNARDAMPKGGSLTVTGDTFTIEDSGPHVRIRVTDTGDGIPIDVQRRIFEPFYTTKAQGSGIGLALVSSIVERHKGFIEFESSPGKGTEFRVILPLAEAGPAAAPSLSQAPRGAGRLLLLLEEVSLREILRGTLEADGYEVISATDVVEASEIHRTRSREIRAVLVNLGLRGLDADTFLKQLIARDPNVRVVNTGGQPTTPESSRMPAVVRATLPKPYGPKKLLEIVANVLDKA